MKVSDFINLYGDKPDAEIRMYVVIDCDGLRTTMPVAWSEYRERDNEILAPLTGERLRMAAQSALGFMEGIVHEDLASQKFVKDSARQQIQQLRDVLYAAYRCGYCNDKIVRAVVGEGYVHVKSGLRTCVGRREDDPSPPSATPEW